MLAPTDTENNQTNQKRKRKQRKKEEKEKWIQETLCDRALANKPVL